eukprot:scpid106814/ scgid25063/ 
MEPRVFSFRLFCMATRPGEIPGLHHTEVVGAGMQLEVVELSCSCAADLLESCLYKHKTYVIQEFCRDGNPFELHALGFMYSWSQLNWSHDNTHFGSSLECVHCSE